MTCLRISAIRLLGIAALTVALPLSASGLSLDFEDPADPNWWSSTTRQIWSGHTISTGQFAFSTFLGPFGNETLEFMGMDIWDQATPYRVSFDLLTFGDWNGDDPGAESVFTVRSYALGWGVRTQVSIATALTNSTQSYPDQIGAGSHPAGTGAIDHVSLVSAPGGTMSIYHFELYMPANDVGGGCCGDAFLEFALDGANGTWGLDNIEFTAVPEPSTGLLVGLGLALLSRRPRRGLWEFDPPKTGS